MIAPIPEEEVKAEPSPPPQVSLSCLLPSNRLQKKKKNRCFTCKKKVGLLGIKCRCENLFCTTHRQPEDHACEFDHGAVKKEILAKQLEKMGAHILAIKDMAGLCKPEAARKLVQTLKGEIGIPIHFHTHDTAGIQAAAILNAAEVGVGNNILGFVFHQAGDSHYGFAHIVISEASLGGGYVGPGLKVRAWAYNDEPGAAIHVEPIPAPPAAAGVSQPSWRRIS